MLKLAFAACVAALCLFAQTNDLNPRTLAAGSTVGGITLNGITTTYTTVAYSATPTFTCTANSNADTFAMTLTGNVTSSTLTGCRVGQFITFRLIQDATGGRTFTWPANVLNAGTPTGVASTVYVQTFKFDGTNAQRETAPSEDGGQPGLTFQGVLFANLGTPANGKLYYCSDCTTANPCAGGGTGAYAERINGAWVCNGGGSGGSGPSITQGTFAALPATCTTNDVYFATDSIYSHARCTATNTWTWFFDGKPVTPLITANWAWALGSQGLATLTPTTGVHVLDVPASLDGLHVRSTTPPATPYSRIFSFKGLANGQNYSNFVFGWSDGTKLHVAELAFEAAVNGNVFFTRFSRYSGLTARVSQDAGPTLVSFQPGQLLYIMLSDDGTNLSAKWSVDGKNFVPLLASISRTAYLTAPSLLVYGAQSGTGGTTGAEIILDVISYQ